MNSADDNQFLFSEDIDCDDLDVSFLPALPTWKICIIDDEKSVHDVTLIALKRFVFQNRKLQFLHAYSAADAKVLLTEHKDIAIILLDVVMEEDDAGLKLVEFIRSNLKNYMSRIILRTGQPGIAPPQKVINEYDINDYKDKTELTVQKLNSSITTALRSYRDLLALQQHRKGLQQVISATTYIHSIHDFSQFVSGLLMQILAVLRSSNHEVDAVISSFVSFGGDNGSSELIINDGTGIFENQRGKTLSNAISQESIEHISLAMKQNKSLYYDNEVIFLFDKGRSTKGVIYLAQPLSAEDVPANLIELFCSNISVSYDNLSLHKELEETQTEIIITLGNISEFRSKETSFHVKRVALYSELIASKMGFDEKQVVIIKASSPLHDIGKIGIKDSILHKTGSLSTEEFEIMQSHAQIGYEMLKMSKRPILKAAAIIAYQHQEKYDGSGYPQGLVGENIHIYGRIVALADVFDALSNDRCYKKAWPLEKVFNFIKEQKGKHFDPAIADTLLSNQDEIKQIFELNQ
ncbi:MAG: DUF3369 domain-containing protein [Pseudomonadota bacterium]